jgi:regulatory protein
MPRKRPDDTKELQPAKRYLAWLLSCREYSAQQLRTKLKQKGYPPEEIESALELMQSYKYQSDERYAQMRARNDAPRSGNRRVRARLAESGIAADLAEEQVAQLAPEAERACALAQRFVGKPFDDALKAKVWRFLAYRGFSAEATRRALARLAEAAAERACDDDIPDD